MSSFLSLGGGGVEAKCELDFAEFFQYSHGRVSRFRESREEEPPSDLNGNDFDPFLTPKFSFCYIICDQVIFYFNDARDLRTV